MQESKQLKINFNGENKRSALPVKYDELSNVISKCFNVNTKTNQIEISYKDDEDDKVRISNQFDLDQALIFMEKQALNLLKVNIESKNEISMISEDFRNIKQNAVELKKKESVEDINVLNSDEDSKKNEFELLNRETVAKVEVLEKKEESVSISKEEMSVLITEAVNRELEGVKEKIVKKLLNKTSEELKKPEKKVEKKAEKKDTKPIAPKKAIAKKVLKKEDDKKPKVPRAVHASVICDGCNASPITGIRYKCSICHDFDYCEKCEEQNKITHLHPFLKIRTPEQAPMGEISCVLRSGERSEERRQRCGGFRPWKMIKEFFTNQMENKDQFGKDLNTKCQDFQDFFTKFGKECSIKAGDVGEKVEKGGCHFWEQVKENVAKFIKMIPKKEDDKESPKGDEKEVEVEPVGILRTEETSVSESKKDDIEIVSLPVVEVKVVKVEEKVEEKKVEEKKVEEKKVEEKKVEEKKVEEKKVEEKKVEVNELHRVILKDMRRNFDLSFIKDEQLLEAIIKAKGVPDLVLGFLFP